MAIHHYKIELMVDGLVHIGSGEVFGKKDYFIQGNKVHILDIPRFVDQLTPQQLSDYCNFLETDSKENLRSFLDRDPSLKQIAQKTTAYSVETPLAKGASYEVAQFIKDAYGRPYIPGSSVKGMLRTILLTNLILADQMIYKKCLEGVRDKLKRSPSSAARVIEKKAFWQDRPDPDDNSVVNDIMRFISVSDSEPLSVESLVFAKKYDRFAQSDDGQHKKARGRMPRDYFEGNELNIYRECLRPGTKIQLSLDIDDCIESHFPSFSNNSITLTLLCKRAFDLYSECFLEYFEDGCSKTCDSSGVSASDGKCRYIYQAGPFAGQRCRNNAIGDTGYCNTHKDKVSATGDQGATSDTTVCYLGGGVDYASKTILNALLWKDPSRVGEIARILYSQFPTKLDPDKHWRLQQEIRNEGFEPGVMGSKVRNGRLIRAKNDHRHWKDVELGVSPHTMKYGIVGEKKYPMGKCSIVIKEC